MKKYFSLLFPLLLVWALIGCAADSSTDAGPTTGTLTIVNNDIAVVSAVSYRSHSLASWTTVGTNYLTNTLAVNGTVSLVMAPGTYDFQFIQPAGMWNTVSGSTISGISFVAGKTRTITVNQTDYTVSPLVSSLVVPDSTDNTVSDSVASESSLDPLESEDFLENAKTASVNQE